MRDLGSIPGLGRPPGEGKGYLLQYSDLGNPMDRGAWQVIVHRTAKSWTQLKQLSTHTHTRTYTNAEMFQNRTMVMVIQFTILLKIVELYI